MRDNVMYGLSTFLRCLLPIAVLAWAPTGCPSDPPPPITPPDLAPCGLGDGSIPDFALPDVNPNSPTYEQEVALGDLSGKVLLIFWMRAT